MITGQMSEPEERQYIQTSVEVLRRATGVAPVGWLGPEYGESARTPQLLAQAGIRYVCDWTNDEQPYAMKTPHGELFALPIMLELDDINALWDRRVTIDRYARLLKESFATLYRDGARNGRVLVLNLHPWLIGQPFRIGYLDDALGDMMRRQRVWAATGAAIIDWYRNHPPAAR
jgi:peptidoglycan/xylan/chitin deacetylase (PgdA/CDA1 family)